MGIIGRRRIRFRVLAMGINADFEKTYASVEEFVTAANRRLVRVQLPWGEKLDFKGVIDLIHMKAHPGDGKTTAEIPTTKMTLELPIR